MKKYLGLVVLSTTLAALITASIAGCDKPLDTTATPPASTTLGTEIDDSVITTRVKSALLADPAVKSFDLKVETRKGEVQLSGFVDNQTQIDQATAVTSALPGVRSIQNKVTLKGAATTVGNKVDGAIITTRVKSALLAEPSIKSFDIAVVTRSDEVQLSGFVDTQSQIDHAVAVTSSIEGVRGVRNEMSIKK